MKFSNGKKPFACCPDHALFSVVFKKEGLNSDYPESITLIESGIFWNGNSLLFFPVGKPIISILKITIPEHSDLPLHFHPTINARVLFTGELDVMDEHGSLPKKKAGDPNIEVVNTIHTEKITEIFRKKSWFSTQERME